MGNGVEIFLLQKIGLCTLEYEIAVPGGSPLLIDSSHSSEESPRPALWFNKGRGIVVHLRPNGNALVIEEWVGAAVSESDPMFVVWDSGSPIQKGYSVSQPDWYGVEGVGSRQSFFGWLKDGNPDIRATLDD